MKTPLVYGWVLVFFYLIILCGAALAVFYWKNLATVSKTQQIACPLNKFCPAGTNSTGFSSNVSIVFPSDPDDITDGEELTFPYYDDFTSPTQKSLVVSIDKTTTSVPGTGTVYNGLSGVGYSAYSAVSPNYTVYIYGLSSYSNVDEIIPAIFRQMFLSSDSPIRKKAFMGVANGKNNSNSYLEYSIKIANIPEALGDLSVSSNSSSSTILSGTDSLNFESSPTVNPEHLHDVYQDMNEIRVLNIAPSLESANDDSILNRCIDPSFQAEQCGDKVYSTICGAWVEPNSEPIADVSDCPKKPTDDWSDFSNDQSAASLNFCAKNLDLNNPNTSGTTSDGSGGNTAGITGYQQNRVAPDVMSAISVNPSASNSPANATYTSGVNGAQITSSQVTAGYLQPSVFCGGSVNIGSDTNNLLTGNILSPYNAKYPNQNTKANGYTNLGWD